LPLKNDHFPGIWCSSGGVLSPGGTHRNQGDTAEIVVAKRWVEFVAIRRAQLFTGLTNSRLDNFVPYRRRPTGSVPPANSSLAQSRHLPRRCRACHAVPMGGQLADAMREWSPHPAYYLHTTRTHPAESHHRRRCSVIVPARLLSHWPQSGVSTPNRPADVPPAVPARSACSRKLMASSQVTIRGGIARSSRPFGFAQGLVASPVPIRLCHLISQPVAPRQ
jgi:hypothetical protein